MLLEPSLLIWKSRNYLSLIVLLVGSMFLVACGNSPDQLETISDPSGIQSKEVSKEVAVEVEKINDMSELRGDIAIDGSSTEFPIVEAVAEEFGLSLIHI